MAYYPHPATTFERLLTTVGSHMPDIITWMNTVQRVGLEEDDRDEGILCRFYFYPLRRVCILSLSSSRLLPGK